MIGGTPQITGEENKAPENNIKEKENSEKKEEKNEEEIKNCKISINNQIIKFNYYHKFQQKGKHIIKYSFNERIFP